jgi:hypothetical protein
MEYFLVFFLAPFVVVAGLALVCKRGKICRSTTDFFRSFSSFSNNQDGKNLVDYAFLIGILAIGSVVVVTLENNSGITAKIDGILPYWLTADEVGITSAILALALISIIVMRRRQPGGRW